MERPPAISVIVVNWNGLQHLHDCLPSLLRQDYPASLLEIIVVDNGSVDGSVEYIQKEFPSIRLLRNPKNEGFAKPNNDAAREARGEYLALINNDMRAHPAWLSEAVKRLDESQGRVCVGSKILSWDGQRVDFNGGTLQFLGYAVQEGIGRPVSECNEADKEILFACGGAMLIRREVFLAAGGFDEDYFAIFEDVDLGWRLWLIGYSIGLAPRSLVFHKLHGTLDRSREEKMRYLMHRNALWTIIKNYGNAALRKVLPLAIVQALHRAVFFSGLDRSSFHLWARQDAQIGHSKPTPDGVVWQSRDALNHLVMLDDVFESLPVLRRKRDAVQAMRKVPDEKILSLFGDPFRSIVQDVHYEGRELDLIEHLRLDELFNQLPVFDSACQAYTNKARTEAARLREEIFDLERQKKQMELQIMEMRKDPVCASAPRTLPPSAAPDVRKTPAQLIHEFREMWRSRGLAAALRQTCKFLFS